MGGQGGQCASFDCVDPVTHVSVTFPDLNSPPFGGEDFQTNLIMPEPCPFLSRRLPLCSIIRPTKTNGIAMGVVKFLTDMGLFHRSIAGVLCLLESAGRTSRCGTTRRLRSGLEGSSRHRGVMRKSAGVRFPADSCASTYHSPPFRRGRRTSSPPQFGQTLFISFEQFSQKVHS